MCYVYAWIYIKDLENELWDILSLEHSSKKNLQSRLKEVANVLWRQIQAAVERQEWGP